MDNPMVRDENTDRVLRALAARRRRVALSLLRDLGTLTLADLADELAEREHGTTIDRIPPEKVKTTYMSLYHRHVPKLEAAGLVEYDQERDMVAPTDRLERVSDTLDEFLGGDG